MCMCDTSSSYVFLLYQQQTQLGERAAQMAPQERGSFNVRAQAAAV